MLISRLIKTCTSWEFLEVWVFNSLELQFFLQSKIPKTNGSISIYVSNVLKIPKPYSPTYAYQITYKQSHSLDLQVRQKVIAVSKFMEIYSRIYLECFKYHFSSFVIILLWLLIYYRLSHSSILITQTQYLNFFILIFLYIIFTLFNVLIFIFQTFSFWSYVFMSKNPIYQQSIDNNGYLLKI